MQTFWVTRFCSLYNQPRVGPKICDLPVKSVLIDTGISVAGFRQVIFRATKEFTGWVDSMCLDEIEYALPSGVVALDHPTASLQDLDQFVFVDGKVQYNLCGELCVCYIAGVPLSTLLTLWKASPTSWYNRVFQKGLARTTGIPDLLNMLEIFPNIETRNFSMMFGATKDVTTVTPARLRSVLEDGWKIIIGVRINRSGELRPSGILHWVTLCQAVPNGIDAGWIKYYNPASNNVELSSWHEFSVSMGSPFGLGARINNDTIRTTR